MGKRSWLVIAALLSGSAGATSMLDLLVDPEDGRFDTSQFLMSQYGFLPVPLVIT